jgi:hypothetical protein
VHHQVALVPRRFAVNDDTNVRHAAAQVPCDQIAGRIIVRAVGNRERFSLAAEKYRQIRDAAMVNILIRMLLPPLPVVRISAPVLHDVLVDLFLQINTDSAVGANNFVRADSGIGGNVSSRIRNAYVRGVVADMMGSPFDCSGDQPLKKIMLS